MVTRGAASTVDWWSRLIPVILLLLGTFQTAAVIYFSSQASEISRLNDRLTANERELAVLRERIGMRQP